MGEQEVHPKRPICLGPDFTDPLAELIGGQ
jgi:hypothetical protein